MRFYFLVAMTGLTSAIYLPQLDSLNLSSVPKMSKFKFGKGRRLQKHVTVSSINSNAVRDSRALIENSRTSDTTIENIRPHKRIILYYLI